MIVELYIAGFAIGLLVLAVLSLYGRVRKLENRCDDLRWELGEPGLHALQGHIEHTSKLMREGFEVLGLERVPEPYPSPTNPPVIAKWVKRS